MRAAIYARYSSDNQKEASIDDQVEVCRRYAKRSSWAVTKVYQDKAQSGGSAFRNGYQQLLADLDSDHFDIVICEALDRLSRKVGDLANLHDRLEFRGIGLHACNLGQVTTMHIGLMGTMAQLYLSDLKEKTKRGQLGRALAGKIPGGKAFGYDLVADQSGERGINVSEAATVRRIFRDYAAGQSPRSIARKLNAEGVPGPEGRTWIDTTIRGQVERGTGILNNSLYVGRIEWNRCSYVKNPQTGKRVARPNPPDQWEVVPVPALRIIDDDLWVKVKERQAAVRIEMPQAKGGSLNGSHRRRYLLSGLLVCGVCGGNYSIIGKDRYGCSVHRGKGTCDNNRTLIRQDVEARVLDGLKDSLMAPDKVHAFITEYHAEWNRLVADQAAEITSLRSRLNQAERGIARIVKAIEDGKFSEALSNRLAELENYKAKFEAQLKENMNQEPVRLHPRLAKIYSQKVANLAATLSDPEIKIEAVEALRGLVDRIEVCPRDGQGSDLLLVGDIANILKMAESRGKKKLPEAKTSGSQLSVVAGAGFEPATFRL
ncbi:MAG: recombinase family protein [Alphaproteobacteria bacterium]|uniref:recombinase family protein n=1 Tax=Marinobacter salarius TaxID=1420917 RepID=UPI0032EDB0A0